MARKMLIIFTITALLVMAVPGLAATIPTVTVTPVSNTIIIKEGETKTGIYTVTNASNKQLQVTVKPRYWYQVEENESIELDSWLHLEPRELELEPHGSGDVRYTIAPPEGMMGELAAMIAFKPTPEKGQQVNVVFSVSLYMVLLGTETVLCEVKDFKIWKHEDRKALGMLVNLENTGNVHVKPRIIIQVQDMLGKNLRRGALQYGKPTYPGRPQGYNGDIFNFQLKPGLYKAIIELEYTNISRRARKIIYFLAGRNGEVVYTFFRKKS